MNNKEYAKGLWISISDDEIKNNRAINSFFEVGSTRKIIVQYKCDGGHKTINLTPANYLDAFYDEVWTRLDIKQKMQILKWHQVAYLTKNGYTGDLPQFCYFADIKRDASISACALKERRLFLELSQIEKMSGLDAFVLVTHECVHHLDYQKFMSVYDELLEKFLSPNAEVYGEPMFREVMGLPVSGKIKNLITGEFERVDENLAKKILFVKNYITSLSKEKLTPKTKCNVSSKQEMQKYLKEMFYYHTPYETKAFTESICYMLESVSHKNKKVELGEKDLLIIEKNKDFLKFMMGKKKEIQKYYKMNYLEAVNMEMVAEFNLKYPDSKYYICPELMEKRNKILEQVWEQVFETYKIDDKEA